MRRVLAVLAALTAVAAPGLLEAQTEINARGAQLRVGGRLHAQYQSSFVDGAESDFFIRRARINTDVAVSPLISGRIQAEFASSSVRITDAWVRLNFSEEFRLSMGQLKRAFDLFELVSSTDLSVIERTGAVAGYNTCTGVGQLCSYSRMIEELELGNRDTGVRADGTIGSFSYIATVTNGVALQTRDVNDAKSYAARGAVMVSENVQVAGNVTLKDYLDPGDESAYAFAWGGDVQVGTWRDGFMLQGSVVGGDNWMALGPGPDFDAPGFLTGQVIASVYVPLDGDRIVGIEPVGRLSMTDPHADIDEDGGILVTPGLLLYIDGKNRFGFNYDYYSPSTGDAVSSFRFGMFLYF